MSDYLILLLLADITKGVGITSFLGLPFALAAAFLASVKDFKSSEVDFRLNGLSKFFLILALTFLMILIFMPSYGFFRDAANVCKVDKTQCISFRGV